MFSIDFSSGNTYPNAEALMNAVLNYEQNRTELNASSPHRQGPSQSPQTAPSHNNPRRHPKSSNSSKIKHIKTF